MSNSCAPNFMTSIVSPRVPSAASRSRAAQRPLLTGRAPVRPNAQAVTVQLVVRVPTRDAQLARCTLHGLLGAALGVHTIDIDRRCGLACLHVELERRRVAEAMALLMRTLSYAEFGRIRQLDRRV
ncbi:hypothetical protein [Paraburkholderia acidisoli]|uniref:NIL domain-containing protein n=1 Tax=Paraburkholderia acidisoli TaxID=2571748 RepID=A0A7Z2GMU6_9BURK|nr:hypothetical protein [Paraburkholderia acidisoli]QGZ64435.1 hypothetical protein FAZ98_22210 [Paraburkholderia acidisoli]